MPAKRTYKVKATNDFLILAAIFFFLCIWAIKDAWFPSEKVMKKHPLQVNVAFQSGGAVQNILVNVGDDVVEEQVLAELRSDRATVEYEKAMQAYADSKTEKARLQQELKELTASGASAEKKAEVQSLLGALQESMDELYQQVEELRMELDAAELKAPSKGRIMKINVTPHAMIEVIETDVAGEVTEIDGQQVVVRAMNGEAMTYSFPTNMQALVEYGASVQAGQAVAGETAIVIDPRDHFYLFNKSLTLLSFILFWVFLIIHILGR